MLKQVKVIPHDQGPAFAMNHRFPDNTHSKEKNGGSKSSPLEKPIPKEKDKDGKNKFFV